MVSIGGYGFFIRTRLLSGILFFISGFWFPVILPCRPKGKTILFPQGGPQQPGII